MYTRRHFERAALGVREVRAVCSRSYGDEMGLKAARVTQDMFELMFLEPGPDFNERFDLAKFRKACEEQ